MFIFENVFKINVSYNLFVLTDQTDLLAFKVFFCLFPLLFGMCHCGKKLLMLPIFALLK